MVMVHSANGGSNVLRGRRGLKWGESELESEKYGFKLGWGPNGTLLLRESDASFDAVGLIVGYFYHCSDPSFRFRSLG